MIPSILGSQVGSTKSPTILDNSDRRRQAASVIGRTAIVSGFLAIVGAAALALSAVIISPLLIAGLLLGGIALTAIGVAAIAISIILRKDDKENSVLTPDSLTEREKENKEIISSSGTNESVEILTDPLIQISDEENISGTIEESQFCDPVEAPCQILLDESGNLALAPVSESEISEQLDYEAVSNMRTQIPNFFQGYDLIGTREWIQFKLNNSYPGDANKFHLSVERSLENMRRAFNILLPILIKYKIETFKMTSSGEDCKGAHYEHPTSNAYGKEFVIYVNRPDDPALWGEKILKEITEEFHEQGIIPNTESKGDVSVEGGYSYVYARNSNNFFNRYIRADCLESSGFTAKEAAYLSSSPWVNLKIDTDPEIIPSKAKKGACWTTDPIQNEDITSIIEIKAEEIQNLTKFYLKSFNDNLTSGFALFKVLFGLGNLYFHDDSSMRYCKGIYSFENHSMNRDPISTIMWNSCLKPEFLKRRLETAARLAAIATLFNAGRFQWDIRFFFQEEEAQKRKFFGGNIVPAVYGVLRDHYLGNKDVQTLTSATFENNDEEKVIIKNLVKCALRDPFNQIKHEQPLYQFDLSEEQIEELADLLVNLEVPT